MRSCIPRRCNKLAEHIQKHSAKEVVGELDGLLALVADGVGIVEDAGDTFLFGQGWQGDFPLSYMRSIYLLKR